MLSAVAVPAVTALGAVQFVSVTLAQLDHADGRLSGDTARARTYTSEPGRTFGNVTAAVGTAPGT
jgi:hypothetical protein